MVEPIQDAPLLHRAGMFAVGAALVAGYDSEYPGLVHGQPLHRLALRSHRTHDTIRRIM
jgi:hypothetical protein